MLAALCVVMKIVEMTTGAGAGKGAADGPQDTVRCPPQPAAPPRSLTNNLNKNNNNSSKNVVNDKLLFRNMSKNNNKNNEWGECRRNNLNKRVNNVNNVWRTQHRMLEWHRRKRHKQEDKKRKGKVPRCRALACRAKQEDTKVLLSEVPAEVTWWVSRRVVSLSVPRLAFRKVIPAPTSLSARSLEVLVTKRNESRAEQAAAQSRAATRTERYTTLTLTLSLSTLRSEMLWTLTLVVALALLQPPVASANNRLADLMENMAELSKCVEAKPRYHVKTGKQCIHRFCSKFKQCTNKKWSECLRLCGTNMQCVLSCATSASKEQCGQDDVPCKVSALNETFGCFCDTFTASHAVGKSGSPLALAAVAVWVLTATVW